MKGNVLMSYSDIIIRLLLSMIIGGIIGYDREFKNMPAGFRTHILVCMGAAVVSMTELSIAKQLAVGIIQNQPLATVARTDLGRMGAQVITGVGFLGAGTIIHEKGSVKGLTTAASIWVVACIGLAVGFGYYFLGVTSAVIAFGVLVSLKGFEDKYILRFYECKLEIKFKKKKDLLDALERYFDAKGVKIKEVEFLQCENEKRLQEDATFLVARYIIQIPKYLSEDELVKQLSYYDQIVEIKKI